MFEHIAYAMGPNPQTSQNQGGGLMGFLPLILIFVIIYFLVVRPKRQKQKEQERIQNEYSKIEKERNQFTNKPTTSNPNLFNCSDCGREISRRAKACPNCGAPVGEP